jgi:hypothetical protein
MMLPLPISIIQFSVNNTGELFPVSMYLLVLRPIHLYNSRANHDMELKNDRFTSLRSSSLTAMGSDINTFRK